MNTQPLEDNVEDLKGVPTIWQGKEVLGLVKRSVIFDAYSFQERD